MLHYLIKSRKFQQEYMIKQAKIFRDNINSIYQVDISCTNGIDIKTISVCDTIDKSLHDNKLDYSSYGDWEITVKKYDYILNPVSFEDFWMYEYDHMNYRRGELDITDYCKDIYKTVRPLTFKEMLDTLSIKIILRPIIFANYNDKHEKSYWSDEVYDIMFKHTFGKEYSYSDITEIKCLNNIFDGGNRHAFCFILDNHYYTIQMLSS